MQRVAVSPLDLSLSNVHSTLLDPPYSERRESAEELAKRVNQRSI
jgi:hypothetical protein